VEGLDLYRAIHRVGGFPVGRPGEVSLGAYLFAFVLRVEVGAGLAAAFGASSQIAGPLGALAVGVAAPKIVEQIVRQGVDQQVPAPAAALPEASASPALQGDPNAA
jgi:hypothetical protein